MNPVRARVFAVLVTYMYLFWIFQAPDTAEEWEDIAASFETKWNYPACLGALDGKHIAIKQPDNSGSEFFNYKHFFSVLLLALVDANYKFVFVDVGAPGRAGDAGVYAESALKKALDADTLNLPEARMVHGMPGKLEHHIIGDDAFPLSTRVMKPHPHRKLDKPRRIFNYRFSRARRVVENAFGILANRFRVFLTTINLSPDKVVQLVLAACCLHNYLVDKNKHAYLSVRDVEDTDNHNVRPGFWRNDPQLMDMEGNHFRNPTQTAKQQRNQLTDYFNSEDGSVPWQEDMTQLRKP